MIITDILSAAKELGGLGELVSKARQEKRDRLAGCLEAISSTLADVVANLRAEDRSVGPCGELGALAESMEGVFGGAFGRERAQELTRKLNEAMHVRTLMFEINQAPHRERELEKLEEAAGQFRGFARVLRAGYTPSAG